MKRVCIYEMKDGSEQVSQEDYSRAEDEQHERAAMEKEIRDPQSHVQGFRFKWVDVPTPYEAAKAHLDERYAQALKSLD